MNAEEILIAFSLGVAFAAPPGVVTVESIRRGLVGGFWSAAAVGLGSLIGDTVYAVLALTGLAAVLRQPGAQLIIKVLSSSILFFLAWGSMKARLPNLPDTPPAAALRRALLSGAGLSLTNPFAIAFWIGFGGVLLSAGIEDPAREIGLFLAAFISGAAIWGVVLSSLIALGRRFLDPLLFRIMSLISATVYVGSGIYVWLSGSH